MDLISCKKFYLGVMLMLACPAPVLAIPAIPCHCFIQRSFDRAHPTLADPYFLATTQNTFFAAVFSTGKMGVVLKKQLGTSADDLWVAYWLAREGAVTPEAVLKARKGNQSWARVIAALGIAQGTLGTRLSAALKGNPATGPLAEAVVDELLLQRRLLGESELAALRKAGVSNQELILVSLAAHRKRQAAGRLYGEIKSGSRSWGELLDGAKFTPGEIQGILTASASPSR